jgi:hypothetical protein
MAVRTTGLISRPRRAPLASAVHGGTVAQSSPPAVTNSSGNDGVIYACAERQNGQLRVVPQGTQCRPS